MASDALTTPNALSEAVDVFVPTCSKELSRLESCRAVSSTSACFEEAVTKFGLKFSSPTFESWGGEEGQVLFTHSGVVDSILEAYNTHRKLVLTPDVE